MALSSEELQLAKQIGAMLLGAGLRGGAFNNAARGASLAKNIVSHEGAGSGASAVDVATRLADDMGSDFNGFDAGIVYVPGTAQHNQMFVHTPDNEAAFLHQTPEEHEAALTKYMSDPRIPRDRAMNLGEREELRLPKFWNENAPRLAVTPSSSCVSSARIGPDGDIYLKFAGGAKEYQYRGNADPVKASQVLSELVTRNGSIGKAVNKKTGDWAAKYSYR